MKMKRVFGLMTAAGCALYAASAMGAASDVVSESFETPADGTAVESVTTSGGTWTGYGTVTASNYTALVAVPSIGRPIDAATSNNVLAVEGRVTHTLTTATSASKPATVDMMVQVALPDDGLAFPANTTTEDIQIAVGVDTNAVATKGELKVYCKNKSGNATGWYSLGTTALLDKDSWHRVSFTFDYAHALCQIRVDGEPMMTANGYLTTDKTNLPEVNGSWYNLAKSDASQLASVQVIGSTAIDELLVKQDTTATSVDTVLPEFADKTGNQTIDGESVPNSWIEQQGITRGTTTAPDGSGMGVGEKYAAGYEVTDGKKFGVKMMSMVGTTATVTFDAANVKTGYTYVLSTSTDNSTWSDATTISSSEASSGSKTIDLGDAAVKYLKLKVVKP
jgi:hypothetical protein